METRWARAWSPAAPAAITMERCTRLACTICRDPTHAASASATADCPRLARWCSARRSASASPSRRWAAATTAARWSAWMTSSAMGAPTSAFDWWPVASRPRSPCRFSSFWWIAWGSGRCGRGRIARMQRISAALWAALGKCPSNLLPSQTV